MDLNKSEDKSADETGDVVLLVGAKPIRDHLIALGMPASTDPYYLRKKTGTDRWPIGSTSPGGGGKLIADKNRLTRHVMKLARGTAACLLALILIL